jgi:hypothetical protein
MPQILRIHLQITVITPFEPQRFIFLLAQLPKLLAMRTVNYFISSSLQEILEISLKGPTRNGRVGTRKLR